MAPDGGSLIGDEMEKIAGNSSGALGTEKMGVENPTKAKTRFAVEVIRRLKRFLAQRKSHLAREVAKGKERKFGYGRTAFNVLIGTILSHRTRDELTEIAANALLARFPTPRKLSKAPLAQIEKLIRPVGFYRSKAKYVKACSRELAERFGSAVPKTMDELTSLTGVGRKTAGCVIVYAHRKPHAIPVDSHVHQVSNRLGLVRTKTPEETERELMRIIPRGNWLDVNELFVVFGQVQCVPVSPLCSTCPLADICPRVGVKVSR
ncbi:endonuclease III [Candidatus Micrarchaeota archaeon]|nr:endonuclease III [Candidatus Micrarchaeota archaeon]MBI5176812.1 endonuclease III [Candidatus Micrarchaeota archaeon]